MLLVKAEARRSPIHGLGLFASEPIKKGTPVARWTEGHDMRMTPAEWAALPARVREWLYIHWWTREDGNWYGTCDDGRFTNHSKSPNMLWDDDTKTSIAARDIAAGEELTEDYGDFDASFPEYAADLGGPPSTPAPTAATADVPGPCQVCGGEGRVGFGGGDVCRTCGGTGRSPGRAAK